MRLHYSIQIIFCATALAFLAGCRDDKTTPPQTISVSVSPSTVNLQTGTTQPFTASVTGTTNSAVTWTVASGGAGGTISAQGLYTAPGVTGTDRVIATSSADSSKSGSATITVTAPAIITSLSYTDPAAGNNFRFIRNNTLSTSSHLVLDLVATGQATASAGLAFTISLNNTDTVDWAKVATSDTMHVQNGAVFTLGSPAAIKSSVAGTQLKAVLAQDGIGSPKNLNSGVLARIALNLKSGVTSGSVTFTVNKFQIIPNTRTLTTITNSNIAFGTLTVTNS